MKIDKDILLDYINKKTVGNVIKIEKFNEVNSELLVVEYIGKFKNKLFEYEEYCNISDIQKFIRTKKLNYILDVE